MRLRALLALFIAAGSASAQDLIGGSSGGATGGGGAPTDATYWLGSANGSLSAEIVVNDIASLEAAISAYDFNDAANLTTGDIAAARMATNVRTAIGSGLTNDRIPRIDGGVLVDNGTNEAAIWVAGQKRFWVDANGHSNIALGRFLYLGYTTVSLQGVSNNMVLRTGANQYIDFQENNQYIVRFGGPDQTALIQDQTATTGDTLLKVLSGAGESGNCQEWDDDGTGALASVDCETGNSVFSNVTLGTTGATFYGPSASEPVDCTTSNDGSMYFDTDDQKLCICANDGTDDEWLHSDNYGHLTGHCSI